MLPAVINEGPHPDDPECGLFDKSSETRLVGVGRGVSPCAEPVGRHAAHRLGGADLRPAARRDGWRRDPGCGPGRENGFAARQAAGAVAGGIAAAILDVVGP
jgi:hypothetical protein